MAPKRWIVTGCTNSPFAFQLVLALRARGDLVMATACHSSELAELAAAGAHTLDLNVMHSQEVIDTAMQKGIEALGGLDVLASFAGYVETGLAEEIVHDKYMFQYHANVMGPFNCARAVLPYFRKQKKGDLLFMGSIGGFIGGATLMGAQYGLTGIVECLRREVSHLGIRTMMVEQGWHSTATFAPQVVMKTPISIPDYESQREALEATQSAMEGTQVNRSKSVQLLIDVVKGEGQAIGLPWPERLPLGPRALAFVKEDLKRRNKVLEKYEELVQNAEE